MDTPRAPLQFRVVADHASSGIWAIGAVPPPWRHGMIGHESLGLTPDLTRRFGDWITWYERDEMDGKLDLIAFEKEGLALAQALKSELGPEAYVEFVPEPRDGKPATSIPIE